MLILALGPLLLLEHPKTDRETIIAAAQTLMLIVLFLTRKPLPICRVRSKSNRPRRQRLYRPFVLSERRIAYPNLQYSLSSRYYIDCHPRPMVRLIYRTAINVLFG